MHDDSQAQEPAAPAASDQPAPEAPQSDAPQPEAAQPSPPEEPTAEEQAPEPEPQAGGDVSTTPATAPAPAPGVPAQPVNAVAEDGSIPAARMEPERIGEATKPPEA